jgi:hypothetical protein
MLDLSSLHLRDTTELHLLHPVTGEKLFADAEKKKPVIASIYGSSSKQYQTYMLAMQNRHLQAGKKVTKAELLKEEGIELLVTCSISISNMELSKGVLIDNADAFRKVYSDAGYSWLKEQVDSAIGEASNFLEV